MDVSKDGQRWCQTDLSLYVELAGYRDTALQI